MEKLNININSKLHYRFRSKFMRLKNNFHQLHYADRVFIFFLMQIKEFLGPV